jgi:hypothetical protein
MIKQLLIGSTLLLITATASADFYCPPMVSCMNGICQNLPEPFYLGSWMNSDVPVVLFTSAGYEPGNDQVDCLYGRWPVFVQIVALNAFTAAMQSDKHPNSEWETTNYGESYQCNSTSTTNCPLLTNN